MAALLALPAAVTAQNGPAKGLPPKVMVAQVDDNGRPFLLVEVVEMVARQVKVPVQVNNVTEERTVTQYVPVQRRVRVHLDKGKARFFDATGKALGPKELAKRLKGETPVLVSTDGNVVDPFYLRLARPETVVVVSPEFAQATVPPGPPPPAPLPEKNPNIDKR
jgi:hypothetical protein